MKVLVAVDGSQRSQHALHFVSTLLSDQADKIVLYYTPPDIKLHSTSELANDLPQLARESLAHAVLERAKGALTPELNAVATTMVGQQHPSQGILAAAETERADLIVVGAHAAPKRSRFFVGGTARYVVHHANVPVLVVRGESLPSDHHSKCVVACDGEGEWAKIARVMSEFSWPQGTQYTLLHVVEAMNPAEYETLLGSMPDRRQPLVKEYIEWIEQRRSDSVDQLQEQLRDATGLLATAEAKAINGNVVECLVEEAESTSANLVVVNARKMSTLGRFLGSTTEGLLSHCPCSMLICHQHAEP